VGGSTATRLSQVRAWVEHPGGHGWRLLDLRAAVLDLLAGYERLAAIHERTTVIAPEGGSAAYCSACGVPYPCDTARAIAETLGELAFRVPVAGELERAQERLYAVLSRPQEGLRPRVGWIAAAALAWASRPLRPGHDPRPARPAPREGPRPACRARRRRGPRAARLGRSAHRRRSARDDRTGRPRPSAASRAAARPAVPALSRGTGPRAVLPAPVPLPTADHQARAGRIGHPDGMIPQVAEFPSMKAKQFLAVLCREPLSYQVARQTGSHRVLRAPGRPQLLFSYHDRGTSHRVSSASTLST
jgi:predicted RNA binding protein YcfA (HicA-like mRNA interferase family)